MLSNNSAELQASPLHDAKAGAAAVSGALLDPYSPIEVASGGTGTIYDPSGTDTRPPGAFDLDLSLLA